MRGIVALVIPAPGPFTPFENAILERRPDLRGRPLTPWHLIAPHIRVSEVAWNAMPVEEKARRVAEIVDEIEPRA